MIEFEQEFQRRASQIPHHGLGLSVDVYSPNLFELLDALSAQNLSYGYLEVFQAPEQALQTVKARLPHAVLECHAEGLWVTQPHVWEAYPVHASIRETAVHLRTLGCSWFNQECASKQIAGYSFGTYLPPLFTRTSAEVTARNAVRLQSEMDAMCTDSWKASPLLLLETPPLTYFGVGDLTYSEYFRVLTQNASCGLVLDIGHVWTVYRYTGQWRSQTIEEFLQEFLAVFPLSRVVQIHLAGLAIHPNDVETSPDIDRPPPAWIDTHGAPIPDILFNMLDQVLAHPRLVHLKGLAMEVDTKSIPAIMDEYGRFTQQYSCRGHHTKHEFGERLVQTSSKEEVSTRLSGPDSSSITDLLAQYDIYVQLVRGNTLPESFPLLSTLGDGELERYREIYLPCEILEWGGDLREMFPRTIARLSDLGIPLFKFFEFWFVGPRPNDKPFDFFLLKIERFVEFVEAEAPSVSEAVNQEASELRAGYQLANTIGEKSVW